MNVVGALHDATPEMRHAMRLAGDLAEFSLPDLLQVKGAARQTAGLRILGPEGNGLIVLQQGEVVHAQYEELVGADAFYALMGVNAGYFEAAQLDGPVVPTIDQPMRELLLDAFRLAQEGNLRRPVRRTARPLPASEPRTGARPSDSMERPAALAPAPVTAVAATETAPGSGRSRLTVGLLAFAGALLVAAAAVILMPDKRAGAATSSPGVPGGVEVVSPGAGAGVFEASDLHGAGDRPPELLSGTPPKAPAEGAAVLPTVVCRLRVDSLGAVVEAKVYRSRVEFEAFEELAIRAVQTYRFRPAVHAGQPVSAWINLPVEFR